jgi:hypothetical protein
MSACTPVSLLSFTAFLLNALMTMVFILDDTKFLLKFLTYKRSATSCSTPPSSVFDRSLSASSRCMKAVFDETPRDLVDGCVRLYQAWWVSGAPLLAFRRPWLRRNNRWKSSAYRVCTYTYIIVVHHLGRNWSSTVPQADRSWYQHTKRHRRVPSTRQRLLLRDVPQGDVVLMGKLSHPPSGGHTCLFDHLKSDQSGLFTYCTAPSFLSS